MQKKRFATMKNKEYINLFFSLLRKSLWKNGNTTIKELHKEEVVEVMSLAEKQSVAGLIFDTLTKEDVKIPQQHVFYLIGVLEQIKSNNRVLNKGVAELHHMFTSSHIKYIIVKGQVVASFYPKPNLRQSGDIDYYCDKENFQKSLKEVKKAWGIIENDSGHGYHIHFDYKGIEYEGHYALLRLYSKKDKDYWNKILGRDAGTIVNIGGSNVFTLSATLHVLYIFLHLFSHLIKLGVGLRQFCDMAVMLHYLKDQIELRELRQHLRSLKMERAYRAIGYILVHNLGLSEKDLGYTLSKVDQRYGVRILDVVLYRGNMGHYNKIGGFIGWKHKIEASIIKLCHFMKFSFLAPRYCRGWLQHEIIRALR